MRDYGTPRTFILSAYKAGAPVAENHAAHRSLVRDLELAGIPFKEAFGAYKGVREDCVLLFGAGREKLARQLSEENGQESYLVVAEHDRIAYNVDVETGCHTCLGKLRNVGQAEPDAEGWTFVDGSYFVASGGGVDLPGGF